jgi:glycosyltransferase involved in cell wall biosynthesis
MTRFGFISPYSPTIGGVATFTRSLERALAGRNGSPAIVRVVGPDDPESSSEAAGNVVATIRPGDPASHREAAEALRGCDAVILQHQLPLYGGEDGQEVVDILTALDAPTITVLHTGRAQPSPNQRAVLERVAELTTSIVVTTHHAFDTLVTNYDVDPRHVGVIPPGVLADAAELGQHRPHDVARIVTWGLLSPETGLDRGIRAFALARMRGLDAEYVIAGPTHPIHRAEHGERHRDALAGLSRALGVEASVHFFDCYLPEDDIAALLASADLVLLPYETREDETSEVLVEAVGAGVPVVATAFPQAVELLVDGAGRSVPHDDLAGMAHAIEDVLAEERARGIVQPVDGPLGITWSQVAARYDAIAQRLRSHQAA